VTTHPDAATPAAGGIRTDRRANLAGALWMVGAMAAFAIEDSLVKAVTARLPVAEVLMLFGAGGAIVFAATALARGERLFGADVVSAPMRARICFEVTGRLFYTLALALTPLSATTAILQATPIVVVLGAALVFGETVGWRRWSAIVLGLIGVLVILRPTPASFSPLSILAVVGMVGFAGRDLASRAAPASISTAALGFWGFVALMLAGLLFAGWEQEAFRLPDGRAAPMLAAAALVGACAYASLMKAMRTGAVASVTPFRYSRLLFGIGLGVVLFDERVDLAMAVGCAIVVASGLFILWRSSRKPPARPSRPEGYLLPGQEQGGPS
jgi:drug/metabolite transporter (DMT)-like permease